ncbi:MAG: 3-polyprenyl-4-hydroxybenzoate decarboxylase [Microbacterium sp.]|jgi:hypothetical protein|nr:3-polyprenyl-4-hydroxybenzoate decarboxylase [Microbacterium sp.]
MVMEASLSRPGHVAAPNADPSAPTEIPWTRIDMDLYEVARDGYIAGYVEVVGSVFVALGGTRYDRAVEVAQLLTFHAAVEAVLRRSA